MLDCFVVVLLVFMGLRDDRRAPGEPHTSLFRMRDVSPGDAGRSQKNPERTWDDPWDAGA